LSGRGLCDELITRPEESYRLWCVVVCDLESSRMDAPYIYNISRLRVKRCGELGKREQLEDLGGDGRIVLQWLFKKWMGNHGLD